MPEAPQRGQQRRKPRRMESNQLSSLWTPPWAISPDLSAIEAKILGAGAPGALWRDAAGRRAQTAGMRKGRRLSKARAAWRTAASPKEGPTICSPAGNPAEVRPQGPVAAGWRVRLKG